MIVPTARTAVLLALAAPLALVIAAMAPGAWVVAPALCLAVLAAAVADALAAGRLSELHLDIPGDVEVGRPCAIAVDTRFAGGRRSRVELALSADPRLLPAGRASVPLAPAEAGAWTGSLAFTPTRRGTGAVAGAWLRWAGPLGLGTRQRAEARDAAVRVWPDVAAARSPALQTYLRDAQFGLIARRIRGEGSEFEALAEYQPGIDRRRIDWKSSARHLHLFAKEYETERNSQIVFAFDCGQAMCEPVGGGAGSDGASGDRPASAGASADGGGGVARLDRAVSAALATAYVALKGGDRVSLYGFAARPEVMTPFIAGSGAFHRLQRAAAGLDYRAQEPNFTLALATLAGRLQRRSLVVVFSDFTDPTSAELMIESVGRLVARHVVLFVTIVDEELEEIAGDAPATMQTLAMAVTADALLRQRALVTRRLRQIGVDVIEAPWRQIGTRLIDAYLSIKRAGVIG